MFFNKIVKFNVKKVFKNCFIYICMYNFIFYLFGCLEWVVLWKLWLDLVNVNNLVFFKNLIICKCFLGFGCIKV